MQAVWKKRVIAESDNTIVVEGNHYFPPDDVDQRYVEESAHRSHCGWKGEAHYYDVIVDGERNAASAWFYPETKPIADNIRGYVAFWNGIEVA